ncbi:hypothetical protein LCGC14_0363320 [marine sediment metagenome]|uniref:Uncharacterized protein n=1 Tax=marine sediment metagenome TaxID=412755 RepID=A0A0F9VUI4_9ZZZZ
MNKTKIFMFGFLLCLMVTTVIAFEVVIKDSTSTFNITNSTRMTIEDSGTNISYYHVNTTYVYANEALYQLGIPINSLFVGVDWDNNTYYGSTLNSTINASIDVRVDVTFLQNLLDAVYLAISNLAIAIQNETIIRSGVNESWINETVNLSYIPYSGAYRNIDLGSNNVTVNTNTFFIDSTNKRVSIGTTVGFDPRPGLTVSGDFDVNHTATENDDHAVEIIVDAAGFGDVKGLDIVYITGAISLGEDEEVILINIDESLATGGDVVALDILATEGSATIYGMEAGALVNPIIQLSGTFVNMDSANNSGIDSLINFTSTTADSVIFANDNDYVTIGDADKFEEIEFLLNTTASNPGIKPTFEFSTTGVNNWTIFSPTDGTEGMRHTAIVAWLDEDIPTWAKGAGTEYLIRITRTANSLATVPIENKVQIAAVVIAKWDKDRNLVGINEINASKIRSDNWDNVSTTTSQINDLPICGGGEFTTSDGTVFTCATPVGGGGGVGDKWVTSGGDFISPNTTFGSKVNATGYTADGGTNISKTDVNTTNVFAALFYRGGTEISNIYAAITYVDTRVDSIDNHTATVDTTIGNESVNVALIIDTYIPDNATADRAYTDTRVDSVDNHTATTDTDTQRKGDGIVLYNDSDTMYLNRTWINETSNATIDARVDTSFLQNLLNAIYATFGYVDNRVDSVENFTIQDINDSFNNFSQWQGTYPNIDTDSTDDLDTAKLDNGSIVRSHNTTWLDSWYSPIGYYTLTNFTVHYATVGYYTLTNFTSHLSNADIQNFTIQQINDSFGNWSQYLGTYPNIDTDSTDDLTNGTDANLGAINSTKLVSTQANITGNSYVCNATGESCFYWSISGGNLLLKKV